MNPPVVLVDYIRMLEPDYRDARYEERSEFMDKVNSSDGTQIAFDRLGDSPPVMVVGGAMCCGTDGGEQPGQSVRGPIPAFCS